MRHTLTLLIALVLALPVAAEWLSMSGQMISVRVDGVPRGTSKVALDLGEKLKGLELRREGGAWVGSFAALPELTNPIFRPSVTVYDSQHRPAPLDISRGAKLEMASSEFDSHGAASGIIDEQTVFVFDSDILPDSIMLKDTEGLRVSPLLGHQGFRLPTGMTAETLTSIIARTAQGRALVFSTAADVDIANSKEEL